jgi:phosphoglycolate phosphatase
LSKGLGVSIACGIIPVVFGLLCFDLDGTIVDSIEDMRAALVHADVALGGGDAAARRTMLEATGHGLTLAELFALARPRLNVDGDEGRVACAAFIAAYRAYYHAHLLDRTVPYPGVVETLAALTPLRRDGLRTVIASTKKTDTAARVIAGLGLAPYFDLVLGTDGIPHKPAPDLLLLAARRTGHAGPAMMVGDTVRDIEAGRAAGFVTCAVAYGAASADDLERAAPDHRIERFPDLLPLVVPRP